MTAIPSDRFDEVVRRHGGRLAVSDQDRALTYEQLGALSRQTSAALAASGASSAPVAILLRTEARYPAAILAALAEGRPYVVLDADHPPERNRRIASHAGAGTVVSAGTHAARARALFGGVPVIDLDTLGDQWQPASLASGRPVEAVRRAQPGDTAWIIYTSGSTGSPKGVYQNQAGLLHDIDECIATQKLGPDDRVSLCASPSLSSGHRVAMSALLSGASLHVLPPAAFAPAALAHEINRRAITVFRAVPALFRAIAEACAGARLDSLRLVALGGDRVDWTDYDAFRRICRSGAQFGVNLGATECATLYAEWVVDERNRDTGAQVPVGRAMDGRRIMLLDERGRQVADGEIGEIVVSGAHLAQGYWREPELTKGAFSSDAEAPLRRTYRTGDFGRWRRDGLLEHLGRSDQQIKLAGQRVEPGEVESALRTCPGIRDAAAVIRRDATGAARSLVAYVEAAPGTSGLLPRHVMAMASQRLPRAMQPSLVFLGKLPRLANLKLDRARLAELDAQRQADAIMSDDPLVRAVSAVFEQVLRISRATPEDNVRSLGGDSLRAIEVLAALEARFGIAIPATAFEALPSIRDVAYWISERRG